MVQFQSGGNSLRLPNFILLEPNAKLSIAIMVQFYFDGNSNRKRKGNHLIEQLVYLMLSI